MVVEPTDDEDCPTGNTTIAKQVLPVEVDLAVRSTPCGLLKEDQYG